MSNAFLLIPIFLPILCGTAILCGSSKLERTDRHFIMGIILVTSAITLTLIFLTGNQPFPLFKFYGDLTISLNLDGLGKIFAGIAAVLWPFTALYAFEYMKHQNHLRMFYGFFLISYGVTLGVACSSNILTMYCFYEMLTLSTLPLVLQPMTAGSRRAGRSYLVHSIGGAAFAFVGIVFLLHYGSGADFSMGGVLAFAEPEHASALLFVYVIMFLGLGVKAAVFPLHSWLPQASVAPTPVTALLHAVAVVKAGAFALMRLTYYIFDPEFLRGTWAQHVVMGIALFTILFGSSAALKQVHFKRRLAYSTIANLSYILFGVTLMTPAGLEAGVLHMLFHSLIKIGAFFAAGAVLHNTGKEYVSELDGLGRRMPVTFASFTVFALSLTGLPLFNGFISKWSLATAAVEAGGTLELLGIVILLVSALLTAIYMLNVTVRAYFPQKDRNTAPLAHIKEVNTHMTIPMILLAAACLFLGVYAQPVLEMISSALV